jgi:hypothetical protein
MAFSGVDSLCQYLKIFLHNSAKIITLPFLDYQ